MGEPGAMIILLQLIMPGGMEGRQILKVVLIHWIGWALDQAVKLTGML